MECNPLMQDSRYEFPNQYDGNDDDGDYWRISDLDLLTCGSYCKEEAVRCNTGPSFCQEHVVAEPAFLYWRSPLKTRRSLFSSSVKRSVVILVVAVRPS